MMKNILFLLILLTGLFVNAAVQTQLANKVIIGESISSDKTVEFNNGSGTVNPKIKLNSTSSKLQFSNDGTNFKNIGGSNAVSGINLLTNPGFENGIASGWTVSGGTFTAVTSGSNVMYESTSALYTAASPVGKYIESSLVAVPKILQGTMCMAKVSFIGANAAAELSVFNQSDTTATGGAVAAFTTETNKKDLILYFTCPSSGSIKLRITTIGSGNLNDTYLDEMFLGSAPLSDSTRPTAQIFTSSSGTYTTPAGVKYIKVRMVGGGGGASSTGTAGTAVGSNGGDTTFGTALLTANGGNGGQISAGGFVGGSGGAFTVNSPAIKIVGAAGGQGGSASGALATNIGGGMGGSSVFGGAGGSNIGTAAGRNAAVNSGSGGGAAGSTSANTSGAGGGSGGYLEAIINSPSSSYSYAVGASGAGAAAGTAGQAGGNGGSGVIIVEEYY